MNIKKYWRSILCALAICLWALPAALWAQQIPPLPMDTAVRMGKLDNGLTYFIRHNKLPEGRAGFYIAQKVGSMQEEDNQLGLAHFLEHIAFNGSEHFPGKGMMNWLQNIGVKFGENLNAYTGFDETVYMMTEVPVERKTVVDSCLLILRDWSCGISLEDKEIDAERGVIQEEWRSRDNGSSRAFEKAFKTVFAGNKYGHRFPIGSMDIIRNFKYDELRAYYKKWYRPDLQGIIVVGDINVDEVEREIKRLFAPIPMPKNPAERVYVEVPDNTEPIVAIETDPEVVGTSLIIAYKMDAVPDQMKNSAIGLTFGMLKGLASSMINQRLSDITKKPNAPFLSAEAGYGSFNFVAKTKDQMAFTLNIQDVSKLPTALDALTAEIQRVRQHGFTKGEFDRALKDMMSVIQTHYNERNKRKSGALAQDIIGHFTSGSHLASLETTFVLYKELEKSLSVEILNQMVSQTLSNVNNTALTLIGTAKEGLTYPSPEELSKSFLELSARSVEPYKDDAPTEPLMSKKPKAGKIVKVDRNGQFGSTVWTLSNGVRVILKATDFKEDQILMSARREGGMLTLGREGYYQHRLAGAVSGLGGLAQFDDTALGKVLSGVNASVSTSVGETSEGLSGLSTKADLESLFQLIYLNFTALRSDREAFLAWQESSLAQKQAAKADPMNAIPDSIAAILHPGDKLQAPVSEEEIQGADYEALMKVYRSRFANAYGFDFVFVGNIDEATLRPLVETYLASLPSKKYQVQKTTHLLKDAVRGALERTIVLPLTTPMAMVVDVLGADTQYDQRHQILSAMLSEVLDIAYTESIREREGGTYGVSVGATSKEHPKPYTALQIFFQTDPEKAKHLNGIVYSELEQIKKEGIKSEYFDKVVNNRRKAHAERIKENSYWRGQLSAYYSEGVDNYSQYESILNSITAEDLRAHLEHLQSQGNDIRIIITSKAE